MCRTFVSTLFATLLRNHKNYRDSIVLEDVANLIYSYFKNIKIRNLHHQHNMLPISGKNYDWLPIVVSTSCQKNGIHLQPYFDHSNYKFNQQLGFKVNYIDLVQFEENDNSVILFMLIYNYGKHNDSLCLMNKSLHYILKLFFLQSNASTYLCSSPAYW